MKYQYNSLSLVQLIYRIANKSDKKALSEFHLRRKIFDISYGNRVLFTDYLIWLKEKYIDIEGASANTIKISEKTYDLTLDKFCNLPEQKDNDSLYFARDVNNFQAIGPDCRL